jgi:hypothetical protein
MVHPQHKYQVSLFASGTEKWQYIWIEAWNNAELASEKGDRTHPLHEVMQQPKLLRKGIYEYGLRLYGTLSTNIHADFVENATTLLETTPLDKIKNISSKH